MTELNSLLDEVEDRVRKGENRIVASNDLAGLRELHFELTYQCNEQCIMCDVWPRYRNNPEEKAKELTSEEIYKFVSGSEYLKDLNMVLFSGGEPFLRKDLPELCQFFINRHKQISVGILSNLFATDLILKNVIRIKEYKPYNFWIGSSIDGIGETHDEIRGTKGCFSALEKSITVLRKEHPDVGLSLNFTITTKNYQELEKAYDYAKGHGLNFSAQFAVPWEKAEKFSWSKEELTSAKETIYRILEKMVKDYDELKASRPLDNGTNENNYRQLLATLFYWKGLVDYQEKPSRRFKRCAAGTHFAQVSPIGDLYFCPLLKNRAVGNIRDAQFDFDAIWTSSDAQNLREFVCKGSCHCWLNCTIYPNIQDSLGSASASFRQKLVQFGGRIFNKLKAS